MDYMFSIYLQEALNKEKINSKSFALPIFAGNGEDLDEAFLLIVRQDHSIKSTASFIFHKVYYVYVKNEDSSSGVRLVEDRYFDGAKMGIVTIEVSKPKGGNGEELAKEFLNILKTGNRYE